MSGSVRNGLMPFSNSLRTFSRDGQNSAVSPDNSIFSPHKKSFTCLARYFLRSKSCTPNVSIPARALRKHSSSTHPRCSLIQDDADSAVFLLSDYERLGKLLPPGGNFRRRVGVCSPDCPHCNKQKSLREFPVRALRSKGCLWS